MLSFELKGEAAKRPEEIEIFLDQEGLEALLAQLQLLQEKRTDHAHLMSVSWGGVHLDEVPQGEGNSIVHHVKIYVREGHMS